MRKPTLEQQSVLDNTARVRVVRAAPGSGKTWLVAEVIRQELEKWVNNTTGIAALSFTRVGGEEIRKAVGHELGHPHFVGTIDAFIFRYIIRPFLQKCCPNFATPRLIPGEWGAQHWNRYGQEKKATSDKGINLFGCVYIDEVNGKAVVAYKPNPALPLQQLNGPELNQVKRDKMKMWTHSGCLTHSDAALWASKILEHKAYGAAIRAEITRRFPLLIVDELQDTGYFLGKSVRLLFNEPEVRGLVVGDPDQAIYEFTGARPDLFAAFESIHGATTLSLSKSQRCPPAITAVASHLKDTGGTISPNPIKAGRAFLLRHDDMATDVQRIVDAVTTMRPDQSIKVIARQATTVGVLNGRNIKTTTVPKLGCPSLNHMHRAVINFRQGRQVAALAAALAALDLAIFEHEGVEDTELEKHGIDSAKWKSLAVDCLLKAVGETMTGTLYEWQTRLGEILDKTISGFGLDPSLQFLTGRLRPKRNKGWDTACIDYIPQTNTLSGHARVSAQTVHSVKGETHDVTIFVYPNTRRSTDCPSTIWWSPDEKNREKKRIAYVAMTRSQGDLIVCVSNDCYARLCASRKSFLDSFELMTVSEFVTALGQLETANRPLLDLDHTDGKN